VNNLNSLFVIFVLLTIISCGNVESSETLNKSLESTTLTNKEEPCLSDRSCCESKKEDEQLQDEDCH
tara:strand:+ start:653 stop:853 length:201 start_codon:yes stop_codon:yes gene_type:complete